MKRTFGERRRAAGEWIESRTGIGHVIGAVFGGRVPGGARWAYVFGSALAVILVMQATTGILLALYYVPSVEHAHTTVEYIQKVVPLGWLVRGVHQYGASAVVIVLFLHLAQTFLWGAYKERREALWLTGVLLLALVMTFSVTGYLLPWDQKAFFGSQVAGGIASGVPVLGRFLSPLLLGGSGIGQGTLSRFFWFHVAVLPATVALLSFAHIALHRYRGAAGPMASGTTDARVEVGEPYWQHQLLRDLLAAGFVIAILVGLAWAFPARLGPAADPSAHYAPRPEWYFLWMYEMLKVLPAFIGGAVIPGLLVSLLALAPWLDRSGSRTLRDRAIPIGIFAVAVLAIGGTIAKALADDARNPIIQAQEAEEHRAMGAPFTPDRIGEEPEAAAVAGEPSPGTGGLRTAAPSAYRENCAACHGKDGSGRNGPTLIGIVGKPRRTREDIAALLVNPRAYTLGTGMPAFPKLAEADRLAIADWIATLGPPAP